MKHYRRMTKRTSNGRWGFADRFKGIYPPFDKLAERLCDLEDKIDNGTLVPKYLVVEDCGTYCVCSVDTENLPIISRYDTKEEAQKKVEELESGNACKNGL